MDYQRYNSPAVPVNSSARVHRASRFFLPFSPSLILFLSLIAVCLLTELSSLFILFLIFIIILYFV